MTTIAWDGKTLAADRRVNFSGISDAQTTKIVKTDKGLCGAAGITSLCSAFKRWFEAGEEGEHPSLKVDNEISTAVIIRPDGRMFLYDSYGWSEIYAKHYAMGSGWEIAIGAMKAGKTAEEAVLIAAKLDGNTGDEVDVLEL